MELEFSQKIFKISKKANFLTIQPMGAELFHEDEQTDILKLTVAFCNFVNAPKKGTHYYNT
jgi:hypothetical protein